MKKIFEIPVYAITKSQLRKKYIGRLSKFNKEYELNNLSEDNMNRVVELQTYPQRLWEYNHIVGFITISVTQQDVIFNIYLPQPAIERYRWQAYKKVFLYNVLANGTHFRIIGLNNQEIHKRIVRILDEVISVHIPSKYYVDRDVFDSTNTYIDYASIIAAKEGE